MAGKGDNYRPVDGHKYRDRYEKMSWPRRKQGRSK